jgi:hypothetical protein
MIALGTAIECLEAQNNAKQNNKEKLKNTT